MYDMQLFIKKYLIQIENGGYFTPRKTFRRQLYTYYPTERFPFFTFEVEEDIFQLYNPDSKYVSAKIAIGKRIDNNCSVNGWLIQRPMLTFAVHNDRLNKLQYFTPIEFICSEIFNAQGKYTVHYNSVEVLS